MTLANGASNTAGVQGLEPTGAPFRPVLRLRRLLARFRSGGPLGYRPLALTYGRARPASGAHARHAAQCRSPLFGAVVLTRIPAASALN